MKSKSRRIHLAALLAGVLIVQSHTTSLRAETDSGVVGNGTPSSCTDASFFSAINSGGQVTFNCGGPATITLTSVKQFGLDTNVDGGGVITLTAANGVYLQIFTNHTVTLRNIVISGFSTNVGAIQNFGTLNLDNARMSHNHNSDSGGALHNYSAVNVVNSTFFSNTAVNNGGVLVNEGGVVTIDNSDFVSNYAAANAGGIYNLSGSVNVRNSRFDRNTARNAGAVMTVGELQVESSAFTNNGAFDAGALYVALDASARVVSSTFTSNSAAYGGAIESWGAFTLTASSLSNNSATSDGGGVWIVEGAAFVHDTTISGNASRLGGGLSNYNGLPGITKIRNVTINNNAASEDGGGIYNSGDLQAENVTISNNRAGAANNGGGLYSASGGNTQLQFGTVTGNQAQAGGGVYGTIGSSSLVTVARSIVTANTGGDCAGTIVSGGYNVSSGNTCNAFVATGDALNANVPLGILKMNGGATATHLPLSGNVAIDRIPVPNCALLDGTTFLDQRSASRPIRALCDSGAVEGNAIALLPLALKDWSSFFEGPLEAEPNGELSTANGPLRSGTLYQGYQTNPSDSDDYYRIVLDTSRTVTVRLTNHSGAVGVPAPSPIQLQLKNANNLIVRAVTVAPFELSATVPAGTYYIRVFVDPSRGNFSINSPYTLQVTY